MATNDHCLICRRPLSGRVLNLGVLPPCNRFTETPDVFDCHEMAITACESCGLVQAPKPPPLSFITPRVPWIRYNEPEAHTAAVAETIVASFRKAPSTAIGVGPFDQPLLKNFERLGLICEPLDLLANLPRPMGSNAFPYIETIQSQIRPNIFARMRKREADIVSCRYLLEHCYDPLASLVALKHLIAPGGVLLIEVPDSSKFIAALDYSFIWEEHVCYFVEATIKNMALQAGFEIAAFLRYEGALEDALVIALRPSRIDPIPLETPSDDLKSFDAYCSAFPSRNDAFQKRLKEFATKGKVALIGMGHQAIMFLNEFKLQPFISFYIDDDPNKVGKFAPGATLPIVPSTILHGRRDVAACLLAVSPRIQEIIREKLRSLSEIGTEIIPIYAGAQGRKLLKGSP